MELSDLEIGYIAGMLDGEGSICYCFDRRGRRQVWVKVCSTDKKVIEWLHARITKSKVRSNGNLKANHFGHKEVWDCVIEDHLSVLSFLRTVKGSLHIKRQKAEDCIHWIQSFHWTPVGKERAALMRVGRWGCGLGKLFDT